MKKTILLFSITVIIIAIIITSNSTGPNDDYTGSPANNRNCTTCHNGNLNHTGLEVSIVPSTYSLGDTLDIKYTITNHTGTNGFQLLGFDTTTNRTIGNFIAGTGTRILNSNIITHSTPSSTGIWNFKYIVPSNAGNSISFYSSANAANGNGTTSGDTIYSNVTTISKTKTNSITLEYSKITPKECIFNNGSIYVKPIGGTPPYHYNWSNSSIDTNFITDLSSGSYSVTITDDNSTSTADFNFIVPYSSNITLTADLTHVDCFGSNTGAISNIQVMNFHGTYPETVEYYVKTTENKFKNLSAGNYKMDTTITISFMSCSIDTTFEILNQNPEIEIDIISTTVPSSSTACDGAVEISAKGGTGTPYTYLWSDPNSSTTNSISNLCSKEYSVTVTDNIDCAKNFTLDISKPPTGIHSIENLVNTIYPNPINNFLFIDLNYSGYIKIKLIDILGKVVFNQTKQYTHPIQLNVNQIHNGFYNLNIISLDNNEVITKRAIIKN